MCVQQHGQGLRWSEISRVLKERQNICGKTIQSSGNCRSRAWNPDFTLRLDVQRWRKTNRTPNFKELTVKWEKQWILIKLITLKIQETCGLWERSKCLVVLGVGVEVGDGTWSDLVFTDRTRVLSWPLAWKLMVQSQNRLQEVHQKEWPLPGGQRAANSWRPAESP